MYTDFTGKNDNDGAIYKVVWNQSPLAEVLRNEVPEIEKIARINTGNITGSFASRNPQSIRHQKH